VNGANKQFYDRNLERTLENSNGGEDQSCESDVICAYYVHENNLGTYPQAKFLDHQHCEAVLHNEYQCSVISEEMCKELKFTGVNTLELPVQNVVLMRALGKQRE